MSRRWQGGINDDTIIAQIDNSHTVYHLSATDIIDLHNAGCLPGFIDFMVNTPSTMIRGRDGGGRWLRRRPRLVDMLAPCPDRVMLGPMASGCGITDGIGRRDIGRSRRIRVTCGWPAIGLPARTAT